jgi:hypothetical protein
MDQRKETLHPFGGNTFPVGARVVNGERWAFMVARRLFLRM